MSTRSRIGIKLEDGMVKSVYCHFDGYLEGVGHTLISHYNDEKKDKKLIAMGDMSSLAESIEKSVFYKRDRGETGVSAQKHSMNEFPDCGQEFEYLFTDGKWKARHVEGKWKTLKV